MKKLILLCVAFFGFVSCTQINYTEVIYYVAPQLMTKPVSSNLVPQLSTLPPCTTDCLQIRENPNQAYELRYKDFISGFVFEAGFNYKLRVRIKTQTSSFPSVCCLPSYELLEQLEKTAVLPAP